MTIDKQAFATGMGLLCGAFGRNIDAAVSRLYYHHLGARLTTEQFAAAVDACVASEKFWPAPAVLLEKVQAPSSDAGVLALRHVNATMGRHGGYQYLPFAVFDEFDAATKAAIKAVGGIREIANVSEERYAGLEKKFAAAYERAHNPKPTLPRDPTDPHVISLTRSIAKSLPSGRDRAAGDR